jgi:iron complex outermembrane receptor protein
MQRISFSECLFASLNIVLITFSCLGFAESVTDRPSNLEFDSQSNHNGLTEILVRARHRSSDLIETHHKVARSEIQSMNQSDISGLMKLLPSASLQTNSRGETQVFMRNAGERQVAVFLDGALLNVPWDNRLDISLIPTTAIDGIDVYTGATSVQFGANVVGGALEITSGPMDVDDPLLQAEFVGGTQNLRQASLTYSDRKERFTYLGSATYTQYDDIPLADKAVLPFNQVGSDARTNTDSENTSLLLRGNLDVSTHVELGMTIFFSDVGKGIAPQGHLNPNETDVRFWRYPDSQNLMTIFNGRFSLSDQTLLKGTFWLQKFDQTIASFTDSSYSQIDEQQIEQNLTFGTRFILRKELGENTLLIAFNGLITEHEQRNRTFSNLNTFIAVPELEFGQNIFSLSGEYETQVLENIIIKMGAGVDWMAATKTGNKPSIPDFVEYNATFGAIYHRAEWSLRAGFAHKTRLPTLRELFGTSLSRFLINPDLQPESNLLGEIAFGWENEGIRVGLVGFASFTKDTIDQRVVLQQGRSLRQRINLRGSQVVGLEMSGNIKINDALTLQGHFSVMDIDRRKDNSGDPDTLPEKPRAIGRFALHYKSSGRLSAMLEIEHRGRAFSPDIQNRLLPLEISTILNFRAAYSLANFLSDSDESEVFFKVENFTDTLVEAQLGLPGAGRWLSAGVHLTF